VADDSTTARNAEHAALVQALFVQHVPRLRGFVLAICPSPSLVDDIVQEVFLTVSAKAEQFLPGTNFNAWANAIARNKVLSLCRQQTQHALLSEEVIESVCACMPEEDRLAPARPHLEACLQRLSPGARRVIELRYLQAHKPQEIARHIGWTPEAVRVALSRARALLRHCVQKRMAFETQT
jgi:RNA polymerase sigma-70 factor, ECF subfamily